MVGKTEVTILLVPTSGLLVIRPQSRIYPGESAVNTTWLLAGNSAQPVRDLRSHEACKRYLTRVESPRGERPMDNRRPSR
jgi:hypothetical protein